MKVPVTISTASIPRFLQHIQNAGVPSKVSNAYIKTVGFKSSNDSAIINVFKALGFIDGTGSPTELWKQYRNKENARKVLGRAVATCYSELFDIYPDANRKDDEAITNFIREKTGLADITTSRAVKTFKILCDNADFEGLSVDSLGADISSHPAASSAPPVVLQHPATASALPISINIELQLPATADQQVYDNLFRAMKEHLLDNESK